MLDLVHLLPKAVPSSVGLLFSLVLLSLALILMFAGKSVVKAVVFLAGGFAGALAGLVIGGAYLGPLGAALGALVGFFVVGFLGYTLLYLGVGIALGYFAYEVAKSFISSFTFDALVGVVFFVVGLVLTNKILELVTAFLGGLIFYDVLVYWSTPQPLALVMAILVGALGLFVQMRGKARQTPRPYHTQPV